MHRAHAPTQACAHTHKWQVKPANLLLTADLATVKISDFGV